MTDLLRQAEAALAARDFAGALELVRMAESSGDRSVRGRMIAASALKASGDPTAALRMLDDVLATEPYHFMALLSKASLLEAEGRTGEALATYRNTIKIAPSDDRLPPAAAAQLSKARKNVRQADYRLRDHLAANLSELRADYAGHDLRRFDESLDILAGVSRAYVQEPLFFHYPRLPAYPFHDREQFDWLETLESHTETIAAEMHAALAVADETALQPYIQYPRGAPVNQWGELNHNRRWSSYFLWRDGERQDAACAACPNTAAILQSLPMCQQPGYAPTAMFSALEAHTHIPPHTGSTNVRLLCHLPLLLPGPARFRVGAETRHWKMGQAWVFDDTIEHEAWNDADSLRVILIFDVWNPLLSEAERTLINALLAARQTFVG